MFKIDLIVWKYNEYDLFADVVTLFKIDLIVWKLSDTLQQKNKTPV